MHICVKMITKVHPRGQQLQLEMPDGATAGELMDHLLQTEELRPYGPDLFFGHVCLQNGLVIPRAKSLSDGDNITIKKLMSGG